MSETGFTSLILAAAGGHLEVVKTLVEKVINMMNLWVIVSCIIVVQGIGRHIYSGKWSSTLPFWRDVVVASFMVLPPVFLLDSFSA